MKKILTVGVVVLALIVLVTGLAMARSAVLIEANCLIWRDTNGDEYKECGADDITAGEVTVSSGSGAPVTTTATQTLTNKTLTSPAITTPVITDGEDAQIQITNVSGILMNVTVSTHALSNGGALTHPAASITNAMIGTGGVNGTNILDATIGAADIAANAVGASELNRITNTLIIAAAATSNGIGNNVLYNSTYTLTPKSNANGNQFIANSTMDVNGNVTVFLNGTADVDYTVEVVRWAP